MALVVHVVRLTNGRPTTIFEFPVKDPNSKREEYHRLFVDTRTNRTTKTTKHKQRRGKGLDYGEKLLL